MARNNDTFYHFLETKGQPIWKKDYLLVCHGCSLQLTKSSVIGRDSQKFSTFLIFV